MRSVGQSNWNRKRESKRHANGLKRKQTKKSFAFETLEPRVVLSAEPVISEFMASNDETILDGYGNSPDWIEIFNQGDQSIDLAGWHLTDDPAGLDKWSFPSVMLEVGQSLVVFASNNLPNTADPAGNLHANFKLSASGEYLALTRTDNSIASEFGTSSEDFLPQQEDISYGIPMQSLIAASEQNDNNQSSGTLLGYWRLDETDTISPAADSSGMSLDGTHTGTTAANVNGPDGFDSAADFDGTTGNVTIGSPASLTSLVNDVTIEAWINPDDVFGVQRIFSSSGSGVSFAIRNDGLRFTTFGVKDYDIGQGTGIIQPGVWTHVAAVMDVDNDVTFYVNGSVVGTVTHTVAGNPGSNYKIGSSGGEFFDGRIDEVAVFSGSLTRDEIRNHFQFGVLGDATPPTVPFLQPYEETFDTDTGNTDFYVNHPEFTDTGVNVNLAAGVVEVTPSGGGDVAVTRPSITPEVGDFVTIELDVGSVATSNNVGIRIGGNVILFHPGHDPGGAIQGAFRVEGPGGFGNQAMNFLPAVGALHHFKIKMWDSGLFEVEITDGNNPANVYTNSFTNLASVGGDVGFHRGVSGTPTQVGRYDNLKITPNSGPATPVDLTFDSALDSFFNTYSGFSDAGVPIDVTGGVVQMTPNAASDIKVTRAGIAPDTGGSTIIELDIGSTAVSNNVGIQIGENTILFHPGHDSGGPAQGAFRIEGPGIGSGLGNQAMNFLPAVGVLHHFRIEMFSDGLFEIEVTDGSNPANVYQSSFTNLNSVGGVVGFHRGISGNPAQIGLYDNFKITPVAGPSSSGDEIQYFIPTDDSLGTTWTQNAFDDNSWSQGSNAIGFDIEAGDFESSLLTTVPDTTDSLYTRTKFTVDDPAALETLILRMKYDDGFIAYINGVKVAERNAPLSPTGTSTATAEQTDSEALLFEGINISQHIAGALVVGENTLAIHALNFNSDDDMLLSTELIGIDEDESVKFFATPTPGSVNSADGFLDFVADTQFSVDRGFYSTSFPLEITSATAGALIVYTTDGSDPQVDETNSIINGTEYTSTITISETSTIRAAAFKIDFQPTNIDTHTYLFLTDIAVQSPTGTPPTGWPTGPVNGQSFDYGMDPEIVNSPEYGSQISDALTAIPSISIVTDLDNLVDPANGIYTHATSSGRAWERPTSVELINPDGSTGFQIDAGIRIRGGFSRGGFNPKHSFRLFFRGEYGDKKLDFPLFGDEGADQFDNIDLRTAQNYAWSNDTFNDASRNTFLRDIFSRDSQRAIGQPYERGEYYHLYINGQYWGMYQTDERAEASYGESYFGGDEDDYDALRAGGGQVTATDGTLTAWHELHALATTGFASAAAYNAVQGKNPDGTDNLSLPVHVDIDNLIDYMTMIFYTGNFDAPLANNFFAIRDRTGREGWQFFLHDSEHSMLDLNFNRVTTSNTGANASQFNPQWLHQQLMANPEYLTRFADRVNLHFFNDGALTPDNAIARILDRAAEIETAIIAESARWGDQHEVVPYTQVDWQAEVDWLVNSYLPTRRDVVLGHLRTAGLYPQLDAPSFNQHGGDVPLGFDVEISSDTVQTFNDTVLVSDTAIVQAFVPTDDSLGTTWTNVVFDDSTWLSGSNGVGYERDTGFETLIGLDLLSAGGDSSKWIDTDSDGTNENDTVYIRYEFNTGSTFDPNDFDRLLMRIKYDDAFVAYLNGTPIFTSDLAPTSGLTWNSSSSTNRAEVLTTVYQDIDLSQHLNLLISNNNVLAIHGLNINATSSDMLILPELLVGELNVISNSPIYYTDDGTDPRLIGGAINPNANLYSSPIDLQANTLMNARVLVDGNWSALTAAAFTVGPPALLVSEVMYNPDGSDDAEFIEFVNTSDDAITLGGIRLISEEIDFTFDLSEPDLGAGDRIVLVRNLSVFTALYDSPGSNFPTSGIRIAIGQYDNTGSIALDNGKDTLTLRDANDILIQEFTYDDDWYKETDGDGFSLVVIDTNGDYNDSANWRSSALNDGSPGTVDSDALPADFNGDGTVDSGDLAILLANYGTVSGANRADGNANPASDGAVDLQDLLLLKKSFGDEVPSSSPPVAAAAALTITISDSSDKVVDQVMTVLTDVNTYDNQKEEQEDTPQIRKPHSQRYTESVDQVHETASFPTSRRGNTNSLHRARRGHRNQTRIQVFTDQN